MIYKIKKGNHRSTPLHFRIWKDLKVINKTVTFLYNSIYPLQENKTHKLFGLGYFWNHHKQSARIGWRYEGSGIFKLFSYCYIDGVRSIREICKVPINTPINCVIEIIKNKYIFKVSYNSSPVSIVTLNFTHNKRWSFPLNLYYGGTNEAPNEIEVKIE